jgi:hypothetical protein
MPSYTTRNRLTKQDEGSNTNTWGAVLNLMFDLIDASLDGVITISTGGATTLSTANGATDQARQRVIRFTATTSGTITIPSVQKNYVVHAIQADCIITNGSASVTVASGTSALVYTDGTVVVRVISNDFGGLRLRAVGAPQVDTDAATKKYVDDTAFGTAAGSLPGQTGNAGKFLTTDGTLASWAATTIRIGTLDIDSGDTVTGAAFTDAIDISDKLYQVGDVLWTARTPGSDYLLCDGATYARTAYPSLSSLLPDGRSALTTFTTRALPGTGPWVACAFGGGVFVALRSDSSTPARSTNGTAWTSGGTLPTSGFGAVAYGNGTFVAVVTGSGTTAATSADGVTWTSRTLPVSRVWSNIAFGNGVFLLVASSSGSNNALTTTDGVTWTQRTSGVSGTYTDLIYGDGVFVALRNSGQIDTTPDGVTWTTITPGFTLRKIIYANGVYVGFTTSGSGPAYVSRDLLNWRLVSVPWSSAPTALATGNGIIVAMAGDQAIWTVDGLSWRRLTFSSGGSAVITGAAYGLGLFVAVVDNDPDESIALSSNVVLDATRFTVPNLLAGNTGERPYIRATT